MAKSFSRLDRVGDQIRKDLSAIINKELKDPRVALLTINDVKVSKDLGVAEVYFTCMALGDEQDEKKRVSEVEAVLAKAAPMLRTLLGKQLSIRVTPMLRFHYDTSLSYGMKMDSLLRDVRQDDDARRASSGEGSEPLTSDE